jgi:outer membrane protein assembly factor BamD (BamD/ComL family)
VVAVEPPPARVVAPLVSTKPRPTASAPEPQGLERELLLLEQARTRLSEGHAQATLDLLRAHRGQYPGSALAQEREALAVKALVAAGRAQEARQLADAFVQRFPGSVLRSSVENAVRTIP